MNQQSQTKIHTKAWLNLILRMPVFAVALLWPAGTVGWWEAWVLIGLWMIFAVATTVFLLRHDPALLAERMKISPLQKGQKAWDKVLMVLMFITGIGIYIIPGLDVVRFDWSKPMPVWVEIVAMIAHVPCFVFIGWVMRENTYLSLVVKIDDARGH